MARGKSSFFQRLTGAMDPDEHDDFDQDLPPQRGRERDLRYHDEEPPADEGWIEDDATEGQLTVDVYQTPDEIIIRSIVAGVRPDDLDVSISRDMVTIRGSREEQKEVSDDNYFHKELYWGSFSRTILLPAEVEVEEAIASEKHGLLTIRLPKVNKEKQTKLKVKSS